MPTQHPPQIPATLLDDGAVRRMLMNDQIVQEFSFMSEYASRLRSSMNSSRKKNKRSCTSCGGGGPTAASVPKGTEYNPIRYQIAKLSKDRQERLKSLMNTKQIRIYYLDTAGQRQKALV